jgi:hypothetical protein
MPFFNKKFQNHNKNNIFSERTKRKGRTLLAHPFPEFYLFSPAATAASR